MSGANVSPIGRNKEEWLVQLPIIGGLTLPPRLRPLRMLRGIFLRAQPPLLSKEGTSPVPSGVFDPPVSSKKMWDMISDSGGEFRNGRKIHRRVNQLSEMESLL